MKTFVAAALMLLLAGCRDGGSPAIVSSPRWPAPVEECFSAVLRLHAETVQAASGSGKAPNSRTVAAIFGTGTSIYLTWNRTKADFLHTLRLLGPDDPNLFTAIQPEVRQECMRLRSLTPSRKSHH